MSDTPQGATVVEESKAGIAVMSVAFVAIGTGLGWLVKAAAGWVADLPWAPFQGPFRVINEITEAEPVSTIVALAVGAVAGAVVAVIAMAEMLRVQLTSDDVALRRGSVEQSFDRSSVEMAYMDGKQLVLVGSSGEELAREQTDLGNDKLAEAFRARGYRWSEDDPYASEFRRWVADTPDLPVGADALFKAREKALQKGDKNDIAELRAELAKLGVVVRDEEKRQYWRVVDAGGQ